MGIQQWFSPRRLVQNKPLNEPRKEVVDGNWEEAREVHKEARPDCMVEKMRATKKECAPGETRGRKSPPSTQFLDDSIDHGKTKILNSSRKEDVKKPCETLSVLTERGETRDQKTELLNYPPERMSRALSVPIKRRKRRTKRESIKVGSHNKITKWFKKDFPSDTTSRDGTECVGDEKEEERERETTNNCDTNSCVDHMLVSNFTQNNVSPCCRSIKEPREEEKREMSQEAPVSPGSPSPVEVGEEKRDYVGQVVTAAPPGVPSTSRIRNKKSKVHKKRRNAENDRQSTSDSEMKNEEQEIEKKIKKPLRKVTRKGVKTSTPVTIKVGSKYRTRKRVDGTEISKFEKVKQKLDEGLLVGLSSSSGNEYKLESTGSSLREAINAGEYSVGDDNNVVPPNLTDDERDSAAKYCNPDGGKDDERDSAAKYFNPDEGKDDERDSAAKYFNPDESNLNGQDSETLNQAVGEASPMNVSGHTCSREQNECTASWLNSSDPILEQVILGLTDRSSKFSNPFQLAEHIQEMLITQAEQAGGRALTWNIADFDRIGGRDTLRTIWADLKAEQRVRGVKMNASMSSDDEEDNKKM